MKILLIVALMLPMTQAFSAETPSLFGKLRYRLEKVTQKGKKAKNRHRIKAALGFKGKVEEKFDYTVALSTGSGATSGNQTLTDNASSKGIYLDLASIKYKAMDNLNLTVGKMKNPFFRPGKTELIWDGDLRPEGLALNYEHKADNWGLGVTFAHNELRQTSNVETNATMDGLQLVGSFNISSIALKVGASSFAYATPNGHTTFAGVEGNTVKEFNIQEFFLELTTKISDIPFSVFADMATNNDAKNDNKASLYGFSLGKLKKANSWKVVYTIREVQKDSVVGTFSDSDFIGGGTDGKGSELAVKYATSDKTSLGIGVFANKKILKPSSSTKDYSSTKIDFNLKF